jgi:hypothetical protein
MDKFTRYFAFTLSAVGLAVLGLATAGLGVAGETAAPPSHKVTICHATNSATNPYVAITVDVSSAGEAQGLHGHREHSDDVIPTFVYDGVTYPGQGDQSILANGCNGSQTTSTESTTTESTTTPTESTTASTESTTTEQTTLVTTEETTTTQNATTASQNATTASQNTTTTDAPLSTTGTTTTTIQTPPTPSGQLGVTTEVSTTNPGASTAPAATTASVPFTPPETKSSGVERKNRVQAEEITRTRLPFTGAPLWEFAFAGALLLAGGFLLLTWKK